MMRNRRLKDCSWVMTLYDCLSETLAGTIKLKYD